MIFEIPKVVTWRTLLVRVSRCFSTYLNRTVLCSHHHARTISVAHVLIIPASRSHLWCHDGKKQERYFNSSGPCRAFSSNYSSVSRAARSSIIRFSHACIYFMTVISISSAFHLVKYGIISQFNLPNYPFNSPRSLLLIFSKNGNIKPSFYRYFDTIFYMCYSTSSLLSLSRKRNIINWEGMFR